MAKSGQPQSAKKRVKVEDLSAPQKEMSKEEIKRVRGGVRSDQGAGGCGAGGSKGKKPRKVGRKKGDREIIIPIGP